MKLIFIRKRKEKSYFDLNLYFSLFCACSPPTFLLQMNPKHSKDGSGLQLICSPKEDVCSPNAASNPKGKDLQAGTLISLEGGLLFAVRIISQF